MMMRTRHNGSLNKIWIEPEVFSIPGEFQQAVGGVPLISQMLFRHGIREISKADGFLNDMTYQPASPLELQGIGEAVELLLEAIKQKKKISVWGDFDVDGQTSTTLLFSILEEIGANVDYHIPVRTTESHGINLVNLERLLDLGTEILLTCDTGITSLEEIDYAQSRGVPVIVTDHHDPPPELPKAFSIINPKLLATDHPLSTLPGVGVAYQLIRQLCDAVGRKDLCQKSLDLVALGIVADLALIKGDTRWLLQQGLKALHHTQRPGLKFLCEMSEIIPENITEEHIAFILAPRLNALGRLGDANRIVEFLTTTDLSKAKIMAVELEGLNAQRKLITDQVFQAAQAQLQANPKLLEEGVIVLANPAWPAGVIGIVASRLVERYYQPAILFSSPPGQVARGSARSIEGVNITEAIAENQNLLVSFGGHPMAAGLSIESSKIPEFHRSLAHTIRTSGGVEQSIASLQIDGYFSLPDLSLDLVTQIERLSPFGPGNPAPVLATRGLSLSGYTSVGRNAEHMLLTVEDETGYERRVIWWQGAGWPLPQGKFDMAYTVRATTYRGQRDIQVEWIDHRVIVEQGIRLETARLPITVVDYRDAAHPSTTLRSVLTQENISIWGEVFCEPLIDCLDRYKLKEPCKTLVIWTIPPGPAELHAVLEKTKPESVFLFGINPGIDTPEPFLKRLVGLVKYAIKANHGQLVLSELAAACAHHIRTIRAGINWLEAHGYIMILERDGDELVIQVGQNKPDENARQTALELKALLNETAAYRAYYLKADKNALINL